MEFNFEVKAIATLIGYVEADSKKEAMQHIKKYGCRTHGCN